MLADLSTERVLRKVKKLKSNKCKRGRERSDKMKGKGKKR
jgi:hypothetical protein